MNKYFMWVLLLVGILVVTHGVFSIRERLEPTDKIKAPPYSPEERERIRQMIPSQDRPKFDSIIREAVKKSYDVIKWEDENKKNASMEEVIKASQPADYVHSFYMYVYEPSKTPITEQDIDSWATIPELRDILKPLMKAYFIDQAPAQPIITTVPAQPTMTSAPVQPTMTSAPVAGNTTSTPAPVTSSMDVMAPATITINVKSK